MFHCLFFGKLSFQIFDKRLNEQGKKEISQKITDVDIQVTEKGIFAHFYKVLIVEKLPLVIPTKIALAVVQGAQTFVNPEGVYINKILENAVK